MSGRGARTACRYVAVVFAMLGWIPRPGLSHEVRPGYLELTECVDGHYDVLWKQPSQGVMAVRLIPHISGGLLEHPPTTIETAPNFQISVWRGLDAGNQGLEGRTLTIEGLGQTITDVLLSINRTTGDTEREILHPQNPSVTLHLHHAGMAVPAYLVLGIEHILTGIDHLSFVFGLLLLVRGRLTLIKTITAFTLAHSVTLAATALHVIAVRPAIIEALVALSILFVAIELVHSYRGRNGLTVRFPWLIALTFGLLHGSAFAGALAEIGLPPHAIALSLLLFNVGVEIGQLIFIAAALALGWMLTQLPKGVPAWTRWVPPYAVGSFAAFWFIQRLQTALT